MQFVRQQGVPQSDKLAQDGWQLALFIMRQGNKKKATTVFWIIFAKNKRYYVQNKQIH